MAKTRQVTFLLGANIKNFKKGLDSAQQRMQRFGRKMKRTGRSLTRSVTLPLAAAGGAAVKMASDFESSMTRIETLVGLSRTQVQGMRSDVLALSRETARAPKELSEALFTVTSAGLRGAESMEVLERASKASAIGLGETREIARATTAIIQAYGKENMSAAQATDTLTAIVREGNLEASELAPVLGRVVGIASQLGVSFSEVGASIATFTRLGVSSEEAVTGLRGVMNALLKPTQQGRKALDEVGLSFEELRRQVQEEGLMATLRGLIGAFDGNIEGLSRVIPRVRALAAVMGTAGAQGEDYEQILNNIQDTTGIVDEGFERVSETTQFKFNKALTNLKNTAIELGSILLPLVSDVLDFVNNLIGAFNNLTTETQKSVLIIAGLLGAGGPLLIALGVATSAIGTLIGMAFSMGGAIAAGASVGVIAAQYLADNWEKVSRMFEIVMLTMESAFKGFLLTTLKGTKGLFNTLTSFAPPEFMSGIFGIDLSEMALDFAGVNSLIDSFEQDLDDNALDLAGALAQYQNLEWGSVGESAKNAFKNVKAIIINELEGILNSEQIQSLLKDLDNMLSGVGGGGTPTGGAEVEAGQPLEKKGLGFQFFPEKGLNKFNKALKKVKGNTDVTKAALGEMTQKARIMGQAFQSTVTNAIVSFGETLGNVLAGKTGAEGFFNSLLLVVLDFANKFGKLLVASGVAAQAFKKLLADPVAAIIAGGALIALTAAIRGLLTSGPQTESVNDALIKSDGSVVKFHPDDNILAMKDFSGLAMSAGGGSAVINNYLQMDGRTIFLGSKEYEIGAKR